MAFVIKDRVKETTTTTGTGTLTLDGAATGFETFSGALGNTNTTYYAIASQNSGDFEVGIGTVGAGTLSRDTVISSSNSDALVNFAAGTKDVFVTLPASKAIVLNDSDEIDLSGNLDLNSNDITGTGNINITGNLTASGNLTSLGIDDNATSTAITIDSSQNVDVAGLLTSDGLTMNTGANSTYTLEFGANRTSDSQALGIIRGSWDGTVVSQINLSAGDDTTNKDNGQIFFRTAEAGSTANRLQIAENGDISFYEDTGTTPKFYWDASNEKLGIGQSNPTMGQINLQTTGNFTTAFTDPTATCISMYSTGTAGDGNYGAGISWGALGGVNSHQAAISSVQTGSDANQVGLSFFTHNSTVGSDPMIERMRIASNGDISFYEDTGTTPKFFWDASTERLGIDTTSPSTALQIGNAVNSNNVITFGKRVTTVEGNKPLIGATSSDDYGGNYSSDLGICATSGTGKIIFYTGNDEAGFGAGSNAERMRITTGGVIINEEGGNKDFRVESDNNANMLFVDGGNDRIGIGTATPEGKLHVEDNSGGIKILSKSADSGVTPSVNADELFLENSGTAGLTIGSGTSGSGTIYFGDSGDDNAGRFEYYHGDDSMRIFTSGSEAMRIDSSGNLLVGKTNNALSNDGVVIREGGEILATNTSDLSGNFNRLSTDGDIVAFYKDGTTIGKIGVNASDNVYLSGNSSHAGIQFGSTSVLGFQNGSVPNNTLDLGNGTATWKDLYLGGGLYVGGTGTANKLDDYEEGTWTPTLTGSSGSGQVYNQQHGAYVKVGKFVVLTGYVSLTNKGTVSGSVLISNFPFTVDNGDEYYSGTTFYNANLTLPSNNYGAGAYPTPNQTYAQMFSQNSGGSSGLNWSAMNNNSQIGAFTIAYITN
jgi:hypothetical protein